MPEIKRQFTGGKMNKDLDERLVPSGQYRHAENIQVSTSEGSAVGTIQNILGNIPGCNTSTYGMPENGFVVGSVDDEKNDTFYWFISGENYEASDFVTSNSTWTSTNSMSDQIWQHTGDGLCVPVLIDQFAFSQINNNDATITSVLDSISPDVIQNIAPGWTVTGVTEDGTTSNTVIIDSIDDGTSISVDFGFVSQLQTSTYSLFVAPAVNSIVKIGNSIQIPMLDMAIVGAPASNWVQSLGNVIYISGFTGSISSLAGASIIIFPNDVNNEQTFSILSASTVSILYANGLGQDLIAVSLDNNLTAITPGLTDPNATVATSISGPKVSGSISGSTNPITAELIFTQTSGVQVSNGSFNLSPGSYDLSTMQVGDSIVFNGINYCVSALSVLANSFGLWDCTTNVPLNGFQVGGFLNYQIQPESGIMFVASDLTVQLASDIDLTTNDFTQLIFTGPRTLNFNHNQFVTAINIVDDMLFWTDGKTEPKKINIPRSIDGTSLGQSTQFLNPERGIVTLIKEEHITVIKRNPSVAPTLELASTKRTEYWQRLTGHTYTSFEDVVNNVGQLLSPGDTGSFLLNNGSGALNWEIGDTISLEEFNETPGAEVVFPLSDPVVELEITNISASSSATPPFNSGLERVISYIVSYINPSVNLPETHYLVGLKGEEDSIFKFKYPSFAIRYKYLDGEYSAFSPFTQTAFIPETWDYQTKKGKNLGMQNQLENVLLDGIIPPDIPDGVAQVDVLYKESGSTNVYLIDEVKINDGTTNWNNNSFNVDSELIHSVIASNQILRPYDNVPRKALAQEVTGNRIVYGNYTQNYTTLPEQLATKFDVSLLPHNIKQTGDFVYDSFVPFDYFPTRVTPLRSIKSLRDYQLGVVFEDKYGRQSPVITSRSGSIKVPKTQSDTANLIDIKIQSPIPPWAESFRFFVKEISNEYYNLAMDRWYDAEDGNVWLSFPSLDRNKITEESTIVLKKAPDLNFATFDNSEYKVIAISNEVPDFVASNKVSYGIEAHGSNNLLGTVLPIEDSFLVTLSPYALQQSLSTLRSAVRDWNTDSRIDKKLFIRFHCTLPSNTSRYYQVATMGTFDFENVTAVVSSPAINIRIDKTFGDDVNFVTQSGGSIAANVSIEIARETPQDRAAYDGRFFVKILKDISLQSSILQYDFDSGTNIEGVINPAFLHYKGINHVYLNDNQISQAWGGTNSGYPNTITPSAQWLGSGVQVATHTQTGNFVSANDLNWDDVLGNGSLSYTYTGTASVGVDDPNMCLDSFTGFLNPCGNGSQGEDRFVAGGGEAGFGRYPRPYPYMVDAFNEWHGGCMNAPSSNYFKRNLDRGGDFWATWFDNNGYESVGWFIDMEPTLYYPETTPVNYYPTSTPVGAVRGFRNTPGRGARLGSNFMDISYVGPDYGDDTIATQPTLSFTDPFNVSTHTFLTTGGNQFRFNGDPGEIVYTIIGYKVVEGIINTYDDRSCNGGGANDDRMNWYGNNGGLFRVRYEIELDQPIGTTIQGHGIITSLDYINAGGTRDEDNAVVAGPQSGQGIPVYAPNWDSTVLNLPAPVNSLMDKAGAFYDEVAPVGGLYSNGVSINSTVWQNTDGSTRFGFIPTESFKFGPAGFQRDVSYANDIVLGAYNATDDAYAAAGPATAPTSLGVFNSLVIPNELYMVSTWNSGSFGQGEENTSANPAIWETLPEKSVDLDLYYESSQSYPVALSTRIGSNELFIPIGSVISIAFEDLADFDSDGEIGFVDSSGNPYNKFDQITKVVGWSTSTTFSFDILPSPVPSLTPDIVSGDIVKFTRPDGSYTTAVVDTYAANSFEMTLVNNVFQNNIGLSYYNCFAFGNGIESDRISDTFNSDTLGKGIKASTVLDTKYDLEHRKYGLIYSGLYNATSKVNNLNQFIAAEKITKDINPTYGSIQKLHSRSTADGDLIALCEDRCLKILANKDALYNADGNMNLTATENVLGQTIPYSGEFGISRNPESFASESYRVYFTDKTRGAVIRLSKDGLTPISDAGMKDWFRDNLKLNTNLVGSYDDRKNEYNITLAQTAETYCEPTIGSATVSYREDVKGWVSFKSFVPENGISCANEYYTFKDGELWKHHIDSVDRNNFYYNPFDSRFSVIFNDMPGSVKSFTTLNYEGSDCRITANLTDGEYFNLTNRAGWYVENVITDLEQGSLLEFIEKEGKWFNYIKGKNIGTNLDGTVVIDCSGDSSFDQASFAIQGLGQSNYPPVVVSVTGCTDPSAYNYNYNAAYDDGSCLDYVYGCNVLSAYNYSSANNTDDGTCIWSGCTDVTAFNYNSASFPPEAWLYAAGANLVDDGSCIIQEFGCTDPTMFNFNPLANTDDGSCIIFSYGCMLVTADNYSTSANTDNGTCTWYGCFDVNAVNYDNFPEAVGYVPIMASINGLQDDGSCTFLGCTDALACNYDADAITDDGTCITNFPPNNLVTHDDGTGELQFTWDYNYAGTFDNTTTAYTPPFVVIREIEWYVYVAVQPLMNWGTANILHTGSDPGGTALNINAWDYAPVSGTSVLQSDVGIYNQGGAPITAGNNWKVSQRLKYLDSSGATQYCTATSSVDAIPATIIPPVTGCTNVNACNYNALAASDDASCEFTSCAGCMDSTASDVNMQAADPTLPCYINGTSVSGACTSDCAGVLGGSDNSCCTIAGCTDPLAVCNYNPDASIDDGSCGYVLGCMEPTAFNFDPWATCSDPNSCIAQLYGCTDDGFMPNTYINNLGGTGSVTPGFPAANYNPLSIQPPAGPAICVYLGCTDPAAINYDSWANADNLSCIINACPGLQQGNTSLSSGAEIFLKIHTAGSTYSANTGAGGIPSSFTVIREIISDQTSAAQPSGNIISTNNNLGNFSASISSGNAVGLQNLYQYFYHAGSGTSLVNVVDYDYAVTFKFTVISNETPALCEEISEVTYSAGCTDPTATNPGSYDISDPRKCIY